MQQTRSIWVPIFIGVSSIAFAITILVGWSIIFTHYYQLYTKAERTDLGVGYWFLLAIGCLFLLAIMVTLLLLLIGNVQQTLQARQQNAFIDSVTHELKSPLASLRLCLETMEMRTISPEMQARFVAMMKKDVERLGDFVEHILEAGKMEHKERTLHYEWVTIPDLLSHCIQRVTKRYPQHHNIVIRSVSEDADPHEIKTDTIALETILINLIDNAIKYSTAPADVEVSIVYHPEHTQIAVSDKGRGLNPRQCKRVFQRFYRVNRSDLPTPRGTGLGLYVVASLVKQLGGYIKAESDGENKGATFTVKLPRRATMTATTKATRESHEP